MLAAVPAEMYVPPMGIYDRHEWLAKRVEQAIDPTEAIIDPHHHLWHRDGSTYLAAELERDTRASHNVTHTVFVECGSDYDLEAGPELAPVGETRFVVREADDMGVLGKTAIGAIVGFADMTLGAAVEEVLAAHERAGAGLFRGIRHGTNYSVHPGVKNGHHDPTQFLMASDAFRAGVACLGAMGHSFDAWLYFDQLVELADLADAVPGCTIVVDHLGGPLGIGPHAAARDEMLSVWRAGIARVAQCPNVVLKVGGIGMQHYFGMGWADRDLPPGSEEVAAYWSDMVCSAIDAFGPDRCMFESNFPVDRQTLPYSVLWNAFQIIAARYSSDERRDLFFDTAARAYRIAT
jgi:predicted TIM-barrel fold metal-dependent hydrolase